MTALDTRAGAPRRAQVILLALSFLGTVLGCTRTPEEPEAEAAAIHVQVTSVRRGEIADVIHAMGQTEALTVLRLASPIAGRLTMLSVYPGDQLEQGAVAARVIPLENEAAAHGFAVLQRQGALSPAERETTRKLRNDIGARDIPLRTPFAAVVAERLRNPGEHVAPNDVLLELFDPHSLYVMAQVPLEAARGLQTGQPAELRAGATVGAGTVAAVVSAVTPQTLTLPVRITLTAPLEPPLLHAAVACQITVARHLDALLIPRSALLSATAARDGTVMVAVAGKAERRSVQLGLHTPDEIEVTGGLTAGDLVLTHGQYGLPDGTRIETDTAPPAPSTPDQRSGE